VLDYFREVGASVVIPSQMDGFCQRQFRQTNKHQRYLNKKPNSELHGEVEFIQISLKNTFLPPSRNEISSLTLG
jgi:hypothetical protein